MAIFKRRLVFWLIRAYLKQWGKIIFVSFLVGLGFFFLLKQFLFSALVSLTSENRQVIGLVGSYTVNSIPSGILDHLSEGLTIVGDNGVALPGLGTSWKILDNGKTYQFTLKKGVYFTDGTPFTSKEIQLSYSDVTIQRPNPNEILFHLKENYAPFLLTLSKPIFRTNFIGIGPYVLKSITLNGSFIETMVLRTKDGSTTRIYQFYPTQDAVKLAFALGEISSAVGLTDTVFNHTSFDRFPNAQITKSINHNVLVTLFYNTQDKDLSDKKIRDGLSYAIPDTFAQGQRAYSPISPLSYAYSNTTIHMQDTEHALVLLDGAGGVKNLPEFTIHTLSKYMLAAKIVQNAWDKIGVKTKIVVVQDIPQHFQIFLGDFTVSKDPDQYTLWHSYQSNNITNFNSDKRIDKLLEDGRQTVDIAQRAKIYTDFQKYLLDEQPATFLYFPYSYTIKRK